MVVFACIYCPLKTIQSEHIKTVSKVSIFCVI